MAVREGGGGWAALVHTLLGVALWNTQISYNELQKSLRQEWAFLQPVTHKIRDSFGPVEDALQDSFLTDLFQGVREVIPGQGSPACRWPRRTGWNHVSSQDAL